jgi:outer membrane receptor protein involved in Fe transport
MYLSASKGYKTGGYNEQAFSKLLQNALAASIMRNAMAGMPGGGAPGGGAPGGGTATPAEPTLEEQLSYDPERSWTYELGGRYEMFDRSLSLNYALFYTSVNNIQIIKLVDQGTAGRVVTNAGKSSSKGFELSLKYNPMDNLSLFADYGFADARFRDYDISEEEDYSGNHIPFAPRHTVSLGASYVHHFGYGSFIDRLVGNIQYAGAGRIYWTESNEDYEGNELYQPFYGVTNTSLSAEKGAFSLELWAKNIFSTKFNSFYFEASDMAGEVNPIVQRSNPTLFGTTLRYTFAR